MQVGLFLKLVDTAAGRTRSVAEVVRTAVTAEQLGFDAVWVMDHLFVGAAGPRVPLHDPLQLLAAIAAQTRHVKLGTLVVCGPFRLPVQLAREAMTLQDASGGRFINGLGAGWNEPELAAARLPSDRLVSRFEAQVDEYRRLLDAPGLVPQGPRPPLWIGASRPRMLRLAARVADGWNAAWFGADPAPWSEAAGRLRRALAETGREPSTVTFSAGVSAVVAEGEEARRHRDAHPGGRYVLGSADEVAAALRAYAAAGCDHAVLSLAATPYLDHPDAMLERAAGVLSLLT